MIDNNCVSIDGLHRFFKSEFKHPDPLVKQDDSYAINCAMAKH